jgi:hypothetical protein
MESTGLFDSNGVEIFVGSNVAKYNIQYWTHDKEHIKGFQIYKIKKVVNDNVVRYNLGDIWNQWSGEDVLVVSDSYFELYGLNYKDIFYLKDGIPIKMTTEKWLGKEAADNLCKSEMDAMWYGFEKYKKTDNT